jgi:hypothetical protein
MWPLNVTRHLRLTAVILFLVGAARADEPGRSPAVVPFDLLITKHIVVQVKINGRGPYRMIFDTGAPVSLLNSRTAKAAGVTGTNGAGVGLSLFGPAAQSSIKKLELGALRAESVPVMVMDHPTVEAVSKLLGPVEGILGFPFFARYKMTLDYQDRRMTFVPTNYQPADVIQALMATLMARDQPVRTVLAPAALWGLEIGKKTGDTAAGVTIESVLADSPAARAGLHSGDRLLTLDDCWTDSVADCYAAAGTVQAGTEVIVRVRRAGKDLELTVKPISGL